MFKMRGSRRAIPLIISADQTTLYNVYTQAGSPTDLVDVFLTVNTGIICKVGITGAGSWKSGSNIYLVMSLNAVIAGTAGGDAGGAFGIGGSYGGSGSAGRNGGPAIILGCNIIIDNTGYIFGGGGQGGGGGGIDFSAWTAGGGGGGGQGYIDSVGNVGFSAGAPRGEENIGFPGGVYASAGANGGPSGPGNGGNGGDGDSGDGLAGGSGGNGGGWGAPGQTGQYGTGSTTTSSPGAGGLGGNAIILNGFSVSWLSGFNGTQVKGAIS
jgi:hypothetical protein